MSEFSICLNKQNNKIEKAKAKGLDKCILIDVKPSIREALTYYYTQLIGYIVDKDGYIHFNHITFSERWDVNLIFRGEQ